MPAASKNLVYYEKLQGQRVRRMFKVESRLTFQANCSKVNFDIVNKSSETAFAIVIFHADKHSRRLCICQLMSADSR